MPTGYAEYGEPLWPPTQHPETYREYHLEQKENARLAKVPPPALPELSQGLLFATSFTEPEKLQRTLLRTYFTAVSTSLIYACAIGALLILLR